MYRQLLQLKQQERQVTPLRRMYRQLLQPYRQERQVIPLRRMYRQLLLFPVSRVVTVDGTFVGEV
jgi:hypothetical protein